MSSVLSVTQDPQGYIWVGTDGAGLQKYDGVQFTHLRFPDQDNDHHVSDIFATPQGTIYFASLYKGFFRLQGHAYKQLYVPEPERGSCLAMTVSDSLLFMVAGMDLFVATEKKMLYHLRLPRSRLINKVHQVIPLDHAAIVLTDMGGFYLHAHGIVKLETWLKKSPEFVGRLAAGRFDGRTLDLYSEDLEHQFSVVINPRNKIHSCYKKLLIRHGMLPGEKILKGTFRKAQLLFQTDRNRLIVLTPAGFKSIVHNTQDDIREISGILIDRNEDFWLSTYRQGLYKVSLEPFTRLEIHPLYKDPYIGFCFKTKESEVLISTLNNKTYIGSFFKSGFEEMDLRLCGAALHQGIYYFATDQGIYRLKNGKLVQVDLPGSDQYITLIFSDGERLWYSPREKGLISCDVRTKSSKSYRHLYKTFPRYFYTAQLSFDQTRIFFGSNGGIHVYDLVRKRFSDLTPVFNMKGSYAGVSTIDAYGTRWFTLEKGLAGITKRDEYVTLSDEAYFPSTLFYTLSSDKYGNLLAGTNKGIAVLRVDQSGHVLDYFNYSAENGFAGYETHMRAQFQDEGSIFLGTIEGLFFINTDILMNLPCPPKPIVKFNKNVRRHSAFEEDDLFQFTYLSVNPKMAGVKYTYRLRGVTDAWSNLTTRKETYFSNLSAGEYIFEVKATYDGIEYGPVGRYLLKREVPFWKTKWFVLLLIISLVVGNILVLDKSKNFQISKIFETKDMEVTKGVISIILCFGLLANCGAHLLAAYVDETIPALHQLNLGVGVLLLTLFIVSLLQSGYRRFHRFLLPVGLLIVVSQSYLGAYLSGIHPFYVIIIALTNTLTPFIFNKIRDVILFSIFHLLCTCSILLLLEDTIYNELLFLIATLVAVCLSVFTTYIRNEALEKLIFISGVINKGSLMTIAIDGRNNVIYTSENTKHFFPFHHEEMIGKPIAELNRYVTEELVQDGQDFSTDFEDDKKYLVPMCTTAGDEVWIEWTCKVFSASVRVIFGQDVTDRVKLASNYGLLVENAEDMIYQADVNGHIVFANQRSLDMLGYTEAELLSKYTVSIADDSYKEAVRKFYRTQFEQRVKTTYFEFPLKAKDGSVRWIGQNTTLLYVVGSERLVSGFLCLARDITEKKAQQELIQEQNSDITASINYAQRIQFNLLPGQEQLAELFRESAVLYWPKDIVSGDFYWAQRIGRYTVFALSDCTGHGVPGSFMTLLGINLLNEVAREEQVSDPAVILTRIDEKLARVLPRGGEVNMRDGMELTLAIFDTETNVVQYASAGGKFIVRNQEGLMIHRGDSKHIGDAAELHFQGYSTHTFSYAADDTFFFLSDGLQDQFGGEKNKKFTLKKILELLEKSGSEPVRPVLRMLDNHLQSWKGKAAQTDDITVVAFRVGEKRHEEGAD